MKGILLINASQQDDLNKDAAGSTDTDLLFHEKQKQLQKDLRFEKDMMEERERRVRLIEDDVLDINGIMADLNSLVNLQGESIGECPFRLTINGFLFDCIRSASLSDTIENSIDHAANDVEAGTSELQKAAEYQARYRRKVIILLLIAVIIGLIVTGLVVAQLKS